MKLGQALFGKIFLIVFLCIILSAFYKGLITSPNEGDSVDYHIPIAKSILSGEIVNPVNLDSPSHTRYYSGNGEVILALFILLGIPLGLYNVLGILILFASSILLARAFKIDPNVSIIFAVTICTLNGILRWSDTQIIDIYLLSFFLLSLSFLESLDVGVKKFGFLGISLGLLIGVKFSGPFLAVILLSVYFKKILKVISYKNFVAFIIPVMLIGGAWYIRNISLTGNPFYPQAVLFFPGKKSTIIDISVLKIMLSSYSGFFGTLNGFISEFVVWAVITPFIFLISVYNLLKETKLPLRLIVISMLVLAVVTNLPSSTQTHIMTSAFRYFHPAIAPLILVAFVYFQRIKRLEILFITSLISILLVEFPVGYFPKLFFLVAPIAVWIYVRGYDYLITKIEKI